ncbi:MAG: hypothetical protein LWX70_05545 [Sphingobacteriia bacterium]|nr:hypothetical protein [Sphingobacteriia bacterium]
MKTKLLFLTLFISLSFLFSCKPSANSGEQELVVKRYPDNKPAVIKYFKVEGRDTTFTKEKVLYQDGKTRLEGALSMGKREGTWTVYREDGKIWSQTSYKGGLEDGPSVVNHENGKVYYEGTYKEGKRIGLWKFYNKEGQLVNENNFDQK